MLGSAMHARLEQLQREVMVVQEQQSKLATQRSEIAMEKELLARAIQDAEAQKKRYAGSKLQLQRENQKIDELKQQASCLFVNWCVCVIIRLLKLVGGPAVKLERKRNSLGIRSSKSTSSIEAISA
jgi:chromosome segregation ATPase